MASSTAPDPHVHPKPRQFKRTRLPATTADTTPSRPTLFGPTPDPSQPRVSQVFQPAPASYGEFYEQWTARTRTLAVSLSIPPQDVDEFTHDALVLFWERGLLQKFDPSRGVSFVTYAYGYLKGYLLTFRSRLFTRHNRTTTSERIGEWASEPTTHNPILEIISPIDQPTPPSPSSPPQEPTDRDAIEQLDLIELCSALTACFNSLTRYPPTTTRNYAQLFYELVQQAADNYASQAEIARSHGHSRQGVAQQIQDLRTLPPIQRLHQLLHHKRVS